ncbi:MAG: hypothetical protein V2B19_30925 [Pseudomonadota bacterium]
MILTGIIGLLLFFVIIVFLRKKTGFLVSVGLILMTLVSLTAVFNRHLPIPVELRHILNLLYTPRDLYEAVISDEIALHVKGYTKMYKFVPKYLDIYEAGVDFYGDGVPKEYGFNGKILFEFIANGIVITEKIAAKNFAAIYLDNNLDRYKKIILMEFREPIGQKQIDDLFVRITVVEPDTTILNYTKKPKFYISVSGSK